MSSFDPVRKTCPRILPTHREYQEIARLHPIRDRYFRCSNQVGLEKQEILDAAHVLKTRYTFRKFVSISSGSLLGYLAYQNIPASPWTGLAAIAIGLIAYFFIAGIPSRIICKLLNPMLPQLNELLTDIQKRQNAAKFIHVAQQAIIYFMLLDSRIKSAEYFAARGAPYAHKSAYQLKIFQGRLLKIIEKSKRGQLSTADQVEFVEISSEMVAHAKKTALDALRRKR